jgi:pilus assembly protein Flp/PilA
MFSKVHLLLVNLQARAERQEGQALVEYALILALIAVISIAALKLMGQNVLRIFTNVNSQLNTVPGP